MLLVRRIQSCLQLPPHVRHAATYARTKPERFLQTIVLSDGATFTVRSTSPRSEVRLNKDIRNHPLWNPAMLKEGVRDESEQLSKFQKRFGADSNLGDLSWIETDEAMNASIKKAAASGGYKKPSADKKSGRGKNK